MRGAQIRTVGWRVASAGPRHLTVLVEFERLGRALLAMVAVRISSRSPLPTDRAQNENGPRGVRGGRSHWVRG